jgi:hypothetical protein
MVKADGRPSFLYVGFAADFNQAIAWQHFPKDLQLRPSA